ncbi:unnamed protein product [Paramecium octaurelia]|uniref:Uncharacterized protein n=1 Tax=Paramecium octaurelia TaxID=43137 RepID=A0A8S1YCP0_PAROT|nr:unnamed protein product [Paramecium octaurelia]
MNFKSKNRRQSICRMKILLCKKVLLQTLVRNCESSTTDAKSE